ncbi:MAG: hypothetical protein GEU28_14830 [Dehalococcoidia bacterium]|nr:hypothetical protein [Dehalococcoidia bacterium]
MSEAEPRPPRFPTTRLWLVRAGDLEDTSFLPDFSGHSDPGLSELGRRQAEGIGRELVSLPGPTITALYASPLAAARATADMLTAALALPGFETIPALTTVMPETLPPGQAGLDSFAMIQEYAWSTVEVLKELHPPDVSIVLVSHELPVRALICKALSIPLEDAERFQVEAGSLSAIEFRGPRTILSLLNDLCYIGDMR